MSGISVTTPPRTVLDLAAISSRQQVEKVLNELEVRGLTDRLSIPDLLMRYPGRQGTRILRTILADEKRSSGVSRNDFEERFVTLVANAGLPPPHLNADVAVGGRFVEADCLWRKQRVIVELDGRQSHGTSRAFEGDRERDRMLLIESWQVIRVTWRQLRDDAPAVIADLRRLLREAKAPTL